MGENLVSGIAEMARVDESVRVPDDPGLCHCGNNSLGPIADSGLDCVYSVM
jgi:hypothetical protein